MEKKLLFLIFLLSIAFACSDNPVDVEPPNNEFSLNITVKDNSNNSVPNLKISAWNKILINGNAVPKVNSELDITATSSIQFSLKESSKVSLNIFDLENTIVDSTISGILAAGNHLVKWDKSEPNRVYKILFKVKKDTLIDTLTFKDSVYAVNYSPDVFVAKIGETDNSGKFETSNKLLFSSLYELPELVATSSLGPEVTGIISILDTITIALWDEQTNKTLYFEKPIIDGSNNFTFTWDSTLAKSFRTNYNEKRRPILNKILSLNGIDPVGFPVETSLSQNYPNPFN